MCVLYNSRGPVVHSQTTFNNGAASGCSAARAVTVQMTCGTVAGFTSVAETTTCNYLVLFPHPAICAGPSSSGSSGGWVFVMIVLIPLSVYFAVGVAYKRFKLGNEWRDSIPNAEFWADLPGLVKDGCGFFVAKCKQLIGSGDGSYTPTGSYSSVGEATGAGAGAGAGYGASSSAPGTGAGGYY